MKLEAPPAAGIPPLKQGHDPERPVVSSPEAARRLGLSRFNVNQRVQRGTLAGYGIQGDQRTRWFVYVDELDRADALDSGATTAKWTSRSADPKQLSTELVTALSKLRKALHAERQAVTVADGIARRALDEWSDISPDERIGSWRVDLLNATGDRDAHRSDVDGAVLGAEDMVAQLLRQLEST
jgi:biotin operon repressor